MQEWYKNGEEERKNDVNVKKEKIEYWRTFKDKWEVIFEKRFFQYFTEFIYLNYRTTPEYYKKNIVAYHNNEYYFLTHLYNFFSYFWKNLNISKYQYCYENTLQEFQYKFEVFQHDIKVYFGYDVQFSWNDDVYNLIPLTFKNILDTSGDDNHEDVYEVIHDYYKANEIGKKENLLWGLIKPYFDNVGVKYQGKFFNENDLKDKWRKMIHCVRKNKEDNSKNLTTKEMNEFAGDYNNGSDEFKKEFLDNLLLFIVTYISENKRLNKK